MTSLDSLRLHLLRKWCGDDGKLDPKQTIDLGSLPPCLLSLRQHVLRCNLQIGIWKKGNENFPEIPKAKQHGWVERDQYLEPLWCDRDVLPKDLCNMLEEFVEVEEENFDQMSDSESENSEEEQ